MHDGECASFTSIDMERKKLFDQQQAPNNCLACPIKENNDFELEKPRKLKDKDGIINGVAYAGTKYHLEDFVLYRAENGPANIGYVRKVAFNTTGTRVEVRKVGRISQLEILPQNIMRDEVSLFFYSSFPFASLIFITNSDNYTSLMKLFLSKRRTFCESFLRPV